MPSASAVVLSGLSASALPGQTKLAPELNRIGAAASLDAIIQYRHAPTAEHHRNMASRGAILKAELGGIQSRAYTVSPSLLRELENDDEVLYVSPNRKVAGLLDYAEPTTNALIAFNNGFDGSGIGVAIIDSGVSSNGDLSGSRGQRVVYNESWVPGGTNDQYGHGQHVAGIVGSNATLSSGPGYTRIFRGIAPNANLVNLRVLDSNGSGTDLDVILAILRAIELKDIYNIKVINLSLGRPVYESYHLDPLCQAVELAWRSGIVVVAAAGNEGRNNTQGTDGYATIMAPGNDPLVITVGAMKDMETLTRADDLIASYSSKGLTLIDHVVKPDVVAPGNRIISTFLRARIW